jgi:hypothetical protein
VSNLAPFVRAHRVPLALALLVIVVIGPIVGPDTAQPASRYSLTASLAEHGSVDVGPYRHRLGVDRAEYRGELRSDKAPGQPLLGVPAYLVGRALGAEPATEARERGDLGVWWQTFWSAVVPFSVLVALMFLFAEHYARRSAALVVALLLGTCTMMLPHAVNLYAHDLAALLAFGAWMAVEPAPASRGRAALGGLLVGAAVLTEYHAGIVLLVLTGYVLVRERSRFGWFVLGAAPPFAVLAAYHGIAFGAPWHTPSAYYAGTIGGTSEGGFTIPGAHDLVQILFGYRGLVVGAPIALVGIVAAAWLAKSDRGRLRVHAIVALAVVVPYLVLCAGWSGLPILEEPGPRYMIPALPFLAVPLAALWDKLWRPTLIAGVLGAAVAVPATVTFLLLGIGQAPFPEFADRVRDREFVPTLWSMGLGRLGVVLYVALVAGCSVVLIRAVRTTERATPPGSVVAADEMR